MLGSRFLLLVVQMFERESETNDVGCQRPLVCADDAAVLGAGNYAGD